MRNHVEIQGRLTEDAKFTNYDNRALLFFTLAVEDIQYDPEAKERRIVSYFFSTEWWMTEPVTEATMLYKGDEVLAVGSLAQRKKGDDRQSHTRVVANQVILLRRSRIGAEASQQGEKAEEAY